jgi:hypothetical protein
MVPLTIPLRPYMDAEVSLVAGEEVDVLNMQRVIESNIPSPWGGRLRALLADPLYNRVEVVGSCLPGYGCLCRHPKWASRVFGAPSTSPVSGHPALPCPLLLKNRLPYLRSLFSVP